MALYRPMEAVRAAIPEEQLKELETVCIPSIDDIRRRVVVTDEDSFGVATCTTN